MSFISKCNYCTRKIYTKLNHDNNKLFTCSKICRKNLQKKNKNIQNTQLKKTFDISFYFSQLDCTQSYYMNSIQNIFDDFLNPQYEEIQKCIKCETQINNNKYICNLCKNK